MEIRFLKACKAGPPTIFKISIDSEILEKPYTIFHRHCEKLGFWLAISQPI